MSPDPTPDPDPDPNPEAGPDLAPRRVVAQGTFDVIHPGHVHYLTDAAARGDELHVIVARRTNVTHKAKPVLPDRQRRDVVAALGVVDHARLGHPEDIFVPIEEIGPDVIVLGFDQHHDADAIRAALDERGIDCDVERASARDPRYDGELLSTGDIFDRVVRERGGRDGD
jgi:FAD synthetase